MEDKYNKLVRGGWTTAKVCPKCNYEILRNLNQEYSRYCYMCGEHITNFKISPNGFRTYTFVIDDAYFDVPVIYTESWFVCIIKLILFYPRKVKTRQQLLDEITLRDALDPLRSQ